MMRRASSASLWCTAMRTSPSPSTDSGKIECGTSELTTVMTPCAWSRLRTTLASMSECVRKMTTRSGNCCRDLVDLEQNHRHIVVLRRGADERRNLAQHALAQIIGRQVGVVLGELTEPRFAEAVVERVHRFADAVGEEQIQISRMERNGLLLEQALEHLAAVDLEAQDHAVRREDARAPCVDPAARHVDQRRVARPRVRHCP